MEYMIVYSSNTGNTEKIAKAIKDVMDENGRLYCGKPDGILNPDAEMIFVGFWVLKGSCTEEIKKYLVTLENKRIFLFGTAGFGGSEAYFQTILTSVKHHISDSNTIIGSFMCQGKMSNNILERYHKLLEEDPQNSKVMNMIDSYNNALSHPDKQDIEAVKELVKSIFNDL